MGMSQSVYIGPYVRCRGAKKANDLPEWAHGNIQECDGGERLRWANGESLPDMPTLFAPNVDYDGEMPFDIPDDAREQEFELFSSPFYISSFRIAFQEELAVMEDFFDTVEVVFGIISTWS